MSLNLSSTPSCKSTYLNPSEIFLQLAEKLGELNSTEREYVAEQLSNEAYLHPKHIAYLELDREVWNKEQVFHGIAPAKLKEFLEDKSLLKKLEETPDQFIFITCERTNDHYDDRDNEPIYGLNFYQFNETSGNHSRIVQDIYNVIMGWRRNAVYKAEKDQKKKAYQDRLNGLIAEFQSGRIDVDKFKAESEKCFLEYSGK